MKVSAHLNGQWLAVPCHGNEKVSWLANEILRRFSKLTSRTLTDDVTEVRLTRGGAQLDVDDHLQDVLDDNDVVTVALFDQNAKPIVVTATNGNSRHMNGSEGGRKIVTIDGSTLTCEDLVLLGKGSVRIELSPESIEKVKQSRLLLENILVENKVVYGVNTGFGKFARTVIAKEDLEQLQENLIRSHSAGVGEALSPERTRMLLALRINVLAKGHSGISLPVLQQYIDAFNANCVSWVPERGTVGASGDLAPLSHLALGLMGEGQMWSPTTGWADAKHVLETNGLRPMKLGPKEGLALINGTQLITALTVEATMRADAAARQADVIAALTLEVLKGTTKAFDIDIHLSRPHKGQGVVAQRFRSLLHNDLFPSEMSESHRFCNRVQDAYTLRAVHRCMALSTTR
jgi:histidine ammonia-lyase